MQHDDHPDDRGPRSEFFDAMRKGLLIGAALLVVVIPPLWMAREQREQALPPVAQAPATPPVAAPQVQVAPSAAPQAPAADPPAVAPVPPTPSEPAVAAAPEAPTPKPVPGLRLADFGGEEPSGDARHVADWAVHTRDHKQRAFVIVDKKDARVYVFGPDGKLRDSAPALLGSAHGDHSVPGIGDKPLSQIKPDEKTTPAGRFVAQPGKNNKGEDIVWVDYDAAVSMHRIRPFVAAERRLERLATATTDDNRISFGCINLPITFYEDVLSPTVGKHGAIVYVLPEKRTPQQLFGSYDVRNGRLQAARASRKA